jgi:hypothetical protein
MLLSTETQEMYANMYLFNKGTYIYMLKEEALCEDR